MKLGFDNMELDDLITWEDFQDKQYYIMPTDPEWEKVPPGLREFYEDPEKHPLGTPSGKLEFYSQRLADHFPDDNERAPSAQVDREQRHPRRAHLERAGQEVSAAAHEQPRPLAHARPERRHQLAAGDQDLQDQGLGRLPVRAHLDQPAGRRGPRHQRRRHRQDCSTSGDACWGRLRVGDGSCRARSPWTTAPGST